MIFFSRNEGEKGGGMYLGNNSVIKIFIHQPLNTYVLVFTDNSAKYG